MKRVFLFFLAIFMIMAIAPLATATSTAGRDGPIIAKAEGLNAAPSDLVIAATRDGTAVFGGWVIAPGNVENAALATPLGGPAGMTAMVAENNYLKNTINTATFKKTSAMILTTASANTTTTAWARAGGSIVLKCPLTASTKTVSQHLG